MIKIRHTSIQPFNDLADFEAMLAQRNIRKRGKVYSLDLTFGGNQYRTNFVLVPVKDDDFDFDFVLVNGCRLYEQGEETEALNDALTPDEAEAMISKLESWTEEPYIKRNELVSRMNGISKKISRADKEILSVETESLIRRYIEKIEALVRAVG